MEKNSKMLAVGAAALTIAAAGAYYAYKSFSGKEQSWDIAASFVDPEHSQNHYLKKTEAQERSAVISDVSYKLAVSIKKGGGTFQGRVEISYKQSSRLADFDPAAVRPESGHIFIDYKGK